MPTGAVQSTGTNTTAGHAVDGEGRAVCHHHHVIINITLILILTLVMFYICDLNHKIKTVGATVRRSRICTVSHSAIPAPGGADNIGSYSTGSLSLSLDSTSRSIPINKSLRFATGVIRSNSSDYLISKSSTNHILAVASNRRAICASTLYTASSHVLLVTGKSGSVRRLG